MYQVSLKSEHCALCCKLRCSHDVFYKQQTVARSSNCSWGKSQMWCKCSYYPFFQFHIPVFVNSTKDKVLLPRWSKMWKQVGIIVCPYVEIPLLPSELESEAAWIKQKAFEGQPGSSVPFREALLLPTGSSPSQRQASPRAGLTLSHQKVTLETAKLKVNPQWGEELE